MICSLSNFCVYWRGVRSAEFVLNPVALLIYIDTLKSWYPPHEKEMMSDAQKKEIIDAIKKALTLLNVKYEIVSENDNQG